MLVGEGNLDGVQVFTLDVLYEGHLHDVIVGSRLDIGRQRLQTCHL